LSTIARFQLGASLAVKAEARHLVAHRLYATIRNPIYMFGSWAVAGGILVFGKAGLAADFCAADSVTDLASAEGVGSARGCGLGRSIGGIERELGFESI
jgi:hypothetical protein